MAISILLAPDLPLYKIYRIPEASTAIAIPLTIIKWNGVFIECAR